MLSGYQLNWGCFPVKAAHCFYSVTFKRLKLHNTTSGMTKVLYWNSVIVQGFESVLNYYGGGWRLVIMKNAETSAHCVPSLPLSCLCCKRAPPHPHTFFVVFLSLFLCLPLHFLCCLSVLVHPSSIIAAVYCPAFTKKKLRSDRLNFCTSTT